MQYRYRLPDKKYVEQGEQFSIGKGKKKITYPANWLQHATDEDLAAHKIKREEWKADPVAMERAKAERCKNSFTYMTNTFNDSSVSVFIPTLKKSYLFGCDPVTFSGIKDLLLEITISAKKAYDNETYSWVPKGETKAIKLEADEIKEIYDTMNNLKKKYVELYFDHKAKIMALDDYVTITGYDYTVGY